MLMHKEIVSNNFLFGSDMDMLNINTDINY